MDTFVSKSPTIRAVGSGCSKILNFTLVLLISVFLAVTTAFSAEVTVKGKVIDKETKKPLKSATVQVTALRVGAISDEQGEFIFQVPEGEHTIVCRFVGYETQSHKINAKAGKDITANFDMSTQSIKTNDIIIIGLSGEVDRTKLGNTIASVSGKEIAKVVSTSAIDAISGRVAGVNVTRNSGQPGAGTYITMRGRKTIAGSSEPLYVVDGIIIDNTSLYDGSGTQQYSNRATDINPGDIESIEILKGASAAAMYGSRAANGVVLITTKRGKLSSYEKPAQITYSSTMQIDSKYGEVPLQTKYGQRKPYKPYTPGSSDSYAGTDDMHPTPLAAGTTVYNNSDMPFRTGLSSEHSLTLIGGVPQFDYMLNGAYSDIMGYVDGSAMQRTNLRANIGISILPGLSVQTNSNFITVNNDLPQDGSNVSGILLGALRTPAEFDDSKYLEDDGVSQRRFASYDNPIWTQKNNKFNQKIERFLHSTEIKWLPFNWITLTGRYGYDEYGHLTSERLAVQSRGSPSQLGQIDHYRYSNKQSNLDFTTNLQYRFFEDKLQTNLVLGSQLIWSYRSQDWVGSTSTLQFYDQIGAGATKDGASSISQRKTVGLFAQLTSTYMDRYSITLALRRDGSSAFGKSEKFHYYPKVGLSYTLSDEEFMQGLKGTVDNIRLRASYGEAGSPDLPLAYATNNLYLTDGNFDPWVESSLSTRGGFNGIRASDAAGAEDINPELNIEREIGIDIGFLNNRVSLEATYYHADIHDLILNVPVAASTGFLTKLKNAGSMWNEGFEVSLKAQPYTTEDFVWSTAFNYSRNYNLVTKLDINPDPAKNKDAFITLTGGFVSILNAAMVGRPLGVFRSAGWLRDKDGNIMYSYWDDTEKKVIGDDWEKNLVGAPRQDPGLIIIGDPNPDFQLSWRNDFTFFQDLTISFLFDGVFGHDVWNGTRGALYNFGTHKDTEDRDQLWIENGKQVMDYTDPQNPVPVIKQYKYRYYYNGFYMNEPHIEDGSFVKLRELVIEYRWRGLRDWNIDAVTFTFAARNLFTITNYSGYDPEVNTFSLAEGRGVDYFTLPQVTSYRFGISILY